MGKPVKNILHADYFNPFFLYLGKLKQTLDMKKVLLFAMGAMLGGSLMAQNCVPNILDTAITLGFVPNPIVGATESVPYDEVVTIVLPQKVDNTLTPSPGDSITLCAISINSITGLPAGYNYEVWAKSGGFGAAYQVTGTTDPDTISINQNANLTRACLRLSNTNPGAPVNPIDSVPITIVIGAWADILGCTDLSGAGGTDTFSVKLPIKSAVYIGIENEIQPGAFAVYSNFPNPADNSTTLNFSTPVAGEVEIAIYEATGRIVRNIRMNSKAGVNSYWLDTQELQSGVYLYTVTYNGKVASKRFMISR